MGVPAFYRWLSTKFPKTIKPAKGAEQVEIEGVHLTSDYTSPNANGEVDNLYLDMNGIVHPCTHPEGKPAPRNEDEMLLAVFRYTENVVNLAKPRKLLMMAVDGVAPRAKMNQQRSRRFRSALDAQISQQEQRKHDTAMGASLQSAINDTGATKWDTNVITPGTQFMDFLAECLKYWAAFKLQTEPGFKDLKIIISDASVPGEGEHKIMEFIRSQRNCLTYDANTSHVIYGLDADLIFLGLATHEPNFRVLREDVFNQNKSAGSNRGHIWLDVGILRQYLEVELQLDVPFWDLERAIDDWIFMAFFCGNDFLPHLPSLDVRENGIDVLLRSWRRHLARMGGYMTLDGDVVLSRVQQVLRGVAGEEDSIFKRRHDIEKRREMSRKQQLFNKRQRLSEDPGADVQLYTARGELVDAKPTVSASVERGRKRAQLDASPVGADGTADDDDENDELQLWKPGYRDRYYKQKFHFESFVDPEFVKEMVYKYIEGVCWVLKYYYQGCPSWNWFYPYHYAPFAQDMVDVDVGTLDIKFPKDTVPFLPFEQLMSVLPAASGHTLPKILRDLMSNPESPIIDFYPETFPIDMNGKKMAWQGVALLPFIDEVRLLAEIRKVYPKLTSDELARNVRGEALLFVSPNSTIASKLAGIYDANNTENAEDDGPGEAKFEFKESLGLEGHAKCVSDWFPKRPLINPISTEGTEYQDLPEDLSVRVEFHMPENQRHKSMILQSYTERPMVLNASDIDYIWHRRQKTDRGDDRPDYRRRELVEHSEERAKREGGYFASLDAMNFEQQQYEYQQNQNQFQGSDSRYNQGPQGYQGYNGYQGQGYQNQNQGYQRYQGQGQGYQGQGQGYQGQGQGYQGQGYQRQGYQGQGQGYQRQGYRR